MKFSSNSIIWDKGIYEFTKHPSSNLFYPHDHQDLIWEKMNDHFLQKNYHAGIIWVPTGGGKTVIGAKWVLKNIIRENRKVIWFTHRLNLLVQAADAFQKIINDCSDIQLRYPLIGALIAGSNINKNSKPTRWEHLNNQCDIVFSTIQSARGKEDLIKKYLKSDNKQPFVIIDECHHAQAPTYYKILDFIKRECSAQLLGLSATPFCTNIIDTRRLQRLFNPGLVHEKDLEKCYIHQIERDTLIKKAILKYCEPKREETKINAKRFFTDLESDASIINQFGELKPAILKRMAEDHQRNQFILDYYKNQQEKFEKTIIFTPNKKANQYLCDLFKKENIYADFVDTDRNSQENQRILDEFRNNDSFKVLINVEIATEGYDAPKTKTVFIARPTRSPGLVQQMIGRAFRGKRAGGIHDLGYIVSFFDDWEGLYQEPKIEEIIEKEDKTISDIKSSIPPDEFEDIKRVISDIISHTDINLKYYPSLESILNHFPIGYYRIENISEDENSRELVTSFIPIFKNLENWEKQFKENVKKGNISRNECNCQKLFLGIPEPHLTTEQILQLFDLYTDTAIPETELFENTCNVHEYIRSTLMKESTQWDLHQSEIINTMYHNKKEIDQDRQFFKNREIILFHIFNYRAFLRAHYLEVIPLFRMSSFPQKLGFQVIARRVGDSHYKFAPLDWYLQSKIKINWLNKEQVNQSQCWGFVNYRDESIHLSEYINTDQVLLIVKEYILFHLTIHLISQTLSEIEINYFEKDFQPSKDAKEELKHINSNLEKFINYEGHPLSLHNPDVQTAIINDNISFCHKFLSLYEFVLRERRDLNLPNDTFLKL